MKEKINWRKVLFIIGVVAMIIGVLDPLEGSVVILGGNACIALSAFLNRDRHWRVFLITSIMIVIGVISLFFLSSLGGFGGNSSLSWWWGIFILPYPAGWLIAIVLLIIRAFKKRG